MTTEGSKRSLRERVLDAAQSARGGWIVAGIALALTLPGLGLGLTAALSSEA